VAFRPKPESFYASHRIDYDAVSTRMLALKDRCAEAENIPSFVSVIQPVYQHILREHLWLMTEDYRQGEMATLIAHLEDCVNAMMPAHLPFVAISREKLYFIPKTAVVRDES
jgi:hypothetical protein